MNYQFRSDCCQARTKYKWGARRCEKCKQRCVVIKVGKIIKLNKKT